MIIIIISLVLLGTLYDLYKIYLNKYREINFENNELNIDDGNAAINMTENLIKTKAENDDEHLICKILLSFSIYSNTIKLFKIQKSAEQLDCLNAIRFLSIAWYF